jgi:hypothetical protein
MATGISGFSGQLRTPVANGGFQDRSAKASLESRFGLNSTTETEVVSVNRDKPASV